MALKNFCFFILMCLINNAASAQVIKRRPIFGKCIDKELSTILKIVTVAEDGNRPMSPTSVIETKLKVDNVMRMIKAYLHEEGNISSARSGRRSRRIFFWPFRPWFFRLPTMMAGGLRGSIYGGYGPGGFTLGADVDGGIQAHWASEK